MTKLSGIIAAAAICSATTAPAQGGGDELFCQEAPRTVGVLIDGTNTYLNVMQGSELYIIEIDGGGERRADAIPLQSLAAENIIPSAMADYYMGISLKEFNKIEPFRYEITKIDPDFEMTVTKGGAYVKFEGENYTWSDPSVMSAFMREYGEETSDLINIMAKTAGISMYSDNNIIGACVLSIGVTALESDGNGTLVPKLAP